MSSTRYAEDGAPLSHEKYLSSPEFSELRAMNAYAVSQRVALLESAEDRELIWFLQGLSIEPGLKVVAKEIAENGADMVAPWSRKPHSNRISKQAAIANRIRYLRGEGPEPEPEKEVLEYKPQPEPIDPDKLLLFIQDLCINPKVGTASGIVEELKKFKAHYERAIKENFFLTTNGHQMWDAFSRAVQTRRIVLINGREGIGKTQAAKAWCKCHLGKARYASLKGITSRTNAFREIAKALGIGRGDKANEIQGRIEEVLRKSNLLLIIDESHLAFNQSERIYKRPELVDWIVTLNNDDVPIALVTTPHFFTCVQRTASQIGWNWHQFKRRIRPYVELKPTPENEIEGVARKLVPYATKQMITFMLGYVKTAQRDLSGLGDLLEEARLRAEAAGRTKIIFEDLDFAATDALLPADTVFLALENRIKSGRKSGKERPALMLPTVESIERNSFPVVNGSRATVPIN